MLKQKRKKIVKLTIALGIYVLLLFLYIFYSPVTILWDIASIPPIGYKSLSEVEYCSPNLYQQQDNQEIKAILEERERQGQDTIKGLYFVVDDQLYVYKKTNKYYCDIYLPEGQLYIKLEKSFYEDYVYIHDNMIYYVSGNRYNRELYSVHFFIHAYIKNVRYFCQEIKEDSKPEEISEKDFRDLNNSLR